MEHNQRVQQEIHETIRNNKKQELLNEVIGGRVKGSMWDAVQKFQSVLESQKCMEACEGVQRSRIQVAEFGCEYFCLDYVSKNGVSITECNNWG